MWFPIKRLMVAMVACGLLAAACSDETDPLEGAEVDSSVTTTSTTATSPTEAVVASESELLAEVWAALFVASGLPVDERASTIAELGPAVPAEFGEVVAAIVDEAQVSEVWPHPIVSVDIGGAAKIRDCMIYDPPVDGLSTVYVEGSAEPDGEGGWMITGYDRLRDDCIPADIQDAVLTDYADGNAAASEFNDPPDPDHPRIAETTTGEILESTRETQAFFRDNGYQLRIDAESNPEVIALYRDDVALIRDCRVLGADGGVFDGDGNRTEEFPLPTREGERSTVKIRMRRENGIWKRAAFEGTREPDSECQFPPTPLGLERIE